VLAPARSILTFLGTRHVLGGYAKPDREPFVPDRWEASIGKMVERWAKAVAVSLVRDGADGFGSLTVMSV
jgi:hypothetical protein